MHSFWVVDRAMEFLRKRDPSAPYFLNISFIDPRVGVNVVHGKQIAQAADPDAERERLLAESADFDTTPWGAAGHFHVDDVIDPRETRAVILRSLDWTCGERFPRPVSERPLLSWPLRL